MDESRSIELTDPRALRALAHPTRLALLALLRREGPHTATSAAAALGESSGSCSFHLRQLRKYGLVEETGEGTGRSKPWRATADFTSWPTVTDNPELADASRLLTSVVLERQFQQALAWFTHRSEQPDEWQRATEFGDMLLHLTPDELVEFNERTWALAMSYREGRTDAASAPAGARPVHWLQIAYPIGPPSGDGH